MLSSTSNSSIRLRRRYRQALIPLVVFAVTFSLLAVAGMLIVTMLPPSWAKGANYPKVTPRSEEWFLAYNDQFLDHAVLYHDLGPSITHARSADILILGNSRTQFAFPFELMNAFCDRHNLKFFNMALGYDEGNVLPEHIIRRHGLKPGLIIINADRFFTGEGSEEANRILSESRFDARKFVTELTLSWEIGRRLHLLFPRWRDVALKKVRRILFRSERHGSWDTLMDRDHHIDISVDRHSPEQLVPLPAAHTQAALAFKELVQSWGGEIVLCYVPYYAGSRIRAAKMAQVLEVPLIAPKLEGLMTFDAFHLNEESAQRFLKAFLSELEQTHAFRKLMKGTDSNLDPQSGSR